MKDRSIGLGKKINPLIRLWDCSAYRWELFVIHNWSKHGTVEGHSYLPRRDWHITDNVIDMYQSGKGYAAFSKAFGYQQTTVRDNFHKKWNVKGLWNIMDPEDHKRRSPENYIQCTAGFNCSVTLCVHGSTIMKKMGQDYCRL